MRIIAPCRCGKQRQHLLMYTKTQYHGIKPTKSAPRCGPSMFSSLSREIRKEWVNRKTDYMSMSGAGGTVENVPTELIWLVFLLRLCLK